MPDRIKVFHVITLLELGGAQRNTLHTVRNLDRTRFDPALVCGKGAVLDVEAAELRAPVHFVPALVRPVRPWKDAAALAGMVNIFRREKPDVVHTHSSKAGILGREAARLAGVPVIVQTFHGFGFTPGQSAPARAFYVALERRAAAFTTALIAVSEANRDLALSLGIGRLGQYHLIRSGVKLSDYLSLSRSRAPLPGVSLSPEHRLVATFGPFKPQKNLADFLEAAALVRRQCPEARFLMAGDGEGRAALEAERRRRGLEDAVFMPGWRKDVREILARADVFALTSRWEGLPRSLVEAMAAGVPPVVNDVDGCRDVVRDGANGFLVPPGRPDLTAERIVRLLKAPAKAEEMGRRARAAIGEEFDIDGMVRRQESLYEGLCAARRDIPSHNL